MKFLKEIWKTIKRLSHKATVDSVYAVAGHSTLFMVISFFPLVMLFLALIKYTPITEDQVLGLFDFVSFGRIKNIISLAINEIFQLSGSFALSLSAITLVWSASTSMYSVMRSLNAVYNIKETRNYFLLRAISILYTVIFVTSFVIALALMVFGNSIIGILAKKFVFLNGFGSVLSVLRYVIAFFILLIIFDILYTVIPNRPSHLLFELPGAVFTSLGWYLFSFFYSVYIENFSNMSYIYGSLTAVVLLLIWLYICMYIFFLGAEVNEIAADFGWCKLKRQKFYKRRDKKNEK